MGHVLGIKANSTFTNTTHVGEVLLVARNATWMVVCKDILVPCEALVARDADEMFGVKVFSQGLNRMCEKAVP